jgi:hypothetical protein
MSGLPRHFSLELCRAVKPVGTWEDHQAKTEAEAPPEEIRQALSPPSCAPCEISASPFGGREGAGFSVSACPPSFLPF